MKKSGQPTYWLGLISLFWSLHVHAQYVVNECQWVYDTMVIIEPELQVEAVGSLVNQAVIIYAGVTSIVNNGGFSEKGDLSSCAASYDLPCAASAGSQGLNVFNTAQAATSMSGNSPLRMHSVLLARNISLATEWQIVQSLNWQSGLVTTDRSEPSQQLHWLGGSVSGAAASRHVNGYAAWSGNGSFVLPIGNGSKMQPVALVGNASCTRFSAAYFSGSPGSASLPAGGPFSTTALESGLSGVSPLEYWDINGSSATTVTLYFDAASSLGTYVSDLSQLVVAGWNGSQWVSLGNTAATGSLTGSGTITSASFTPDDYEAYSFGFVGTSTCAEPTALTTVGTTAGSAQIRWTAGSTPTNRSWEVTIGNPSIAGCSASGSGIIRTTVSYVNNVVSFSAPVTAMSVSGSQISITVGGLQADTDYAFYVAEICDTATPPNSVSACVGPATFSTKDAQYAVTTGTITRPGCPFISPGYAANGAFQVIVSNGATCTGTYRVVAAPVPGSGPSGSTPPATTVTTYIGFGAGTFNFSSAGSGSYLVTVTETGPCNPDSDPVTLTVVVPNGVDSSAPIFYVIDEIGNVILDNDPTSPAGITANYGNISLPEGSCSIRRTYYVYGNDGCEGLISSYNAVTATSSVVPSTVSPAGQVSVTTDGAGYYAVDVNWSVGQNTIQIFGRDMSGNIAGGAEGLRLIANVLDNTDPVVTIMGNSQFTIPVCASSVTGVLTVRVDDLCDQNVNFGSLSASFGGATGTINFTGNNYREYQVTFPAAGSYLVSASYTDANGNVGFVDQVVTVQQAAANQAPIIQANAEAVTLPSCQSTAAVVYSFTITDDCEPINIAQVQFNGGGSGLPNLNGSGFFSTDQVGPNAVYFEVRGNVSPGQYNPSVAYQGQSVSSTITVLQNANQPAVIILPVNLTFTIPHCANSVVATMSVTIIDDCDNSISPSRSVFSLGGNPITPTYTDAANGYFEFALPLTAANDGELLVVSYTDAQGATRTVDALVTIQQANSDQPPVIYAFAESINTPSCADGLPITYSFMITDDCEDIDISQVVFDGGSSGLSAADGFSFVENQGNRVYYFEVSGQVESGDHYITISYQGRSVTRLLRVVSSPDQVGPQVYYPEEGIHVTVETCDGLPVEVPIELAAEDNCGGEVSLALSLPPGLPGATLTTTATGYAVVVTEEGSYPLTVVATDGNGNSTVRSFVLLVDQSIPAELACIELVEVEIPGGTTLPFTAADLLTGDFGCLSSDLFAVQILDNNTANGHILDGPGLFPYRVSLVQPQPVNGFTGDFAANEWSVSSTSFGGSTVITEGLLTLTGPANTYCVGGAQVQASIAIPRSGMLSFNYQWQNADPGWDSLRLSVGSEVLQFTAAANLQASFSRQLAAGEVLNLSIRSADCAMGGGLLQLSNWLFVPDNPAEDIDFSQCSGYITAESSEPADVICPPAMEICINNELVPLDILETVPPSANERSVFTGPGVEAFDLASGLYNFLPAVAGVGEHTILYSYTYLNGQTDNCSFTINVLPAPAPVIAGNLVYCGGESMLTASGGFAFYEWNTGDMTQSISISPTEPTLYEVVVSDAAGCIGSAAVTVTLSEAPTAAISGDLVLCAGESSQLTGSGGLTYTWSTGESSAQIEVSPSITQTYTLSITDEFGCSDIAEVTVTVNPLPQLSVSGDNLACTGGSTITASGSDLTYVWSTGATSASILANIPGTNTYAVTATDVNGCSNTTSYVVTVGDFVAPTITCPTSQSVILPAGICTYQPTGSSWDPMVEDNCSYSDPVYTLSGATIGSGQGSLAAAAFNAGSTTVSWVVSDDAGNIADCSFTVDLLDQTAPNLVCRPSNTITFNGEQTLALSAAALVTTATETCGDVSLSTSLSSLSCTQLGQTLTVTVTATDEAGNSSSCQTLITVAGLPCGWTAPASGINCQGESSVTYDPATAVYTLYSDECQNTPPTNLDELTYAYYRLCGARSYIEARIDNITGVGFAGIVIRESTSPGARKVQHMMSETRNIIRRELRTTTNGSVSGLSLVRNDSRWLKLWRRDNQIIGYVSSTSPSSFTQLYTINMTFTSCVDVGLVLQQTTTAPIEAQFSGVSTMLQSLLPGEAELGSSYEPNAGNMEQNVFPNPTDGVIWLDLSSFLDEAIEIELLDLYSRSIRRQSIGQLDDGLFSMDLSDYASGIYLVKITDSSGIVHTGRVVLQR